MRKDGGAGPVARDMRRRDGPSRSRAQDGLCAKALGRPRNKGHLDPGSASWRPSRAKGGKTLGLAVVSMIILVVLGVVAGLVLARAFGAAVARNEKRPGSQEGDKERSHTSPGEDHGEKGENG